MFTKLWWRRALERAWKSAAQGFIAATGINITGAVTDADTDTLAHLSWFNIGVVTVAMFVLSLATSVATSKVSGDPEDPSIVE